MWKPPERIKHTPLSDDWPSREQAAHSLLFSPVQVGAMTLEQRTWVPAMVPWRASDDGFVTEEVLDWYGRFARGRPGAIVVEATGIRDVPSGPLLRIGHDRFLPGLRQLVERVRQESGGHTRLFIQIIDFLGIRRRPERTRYLERFLQVSDSHRQALGEPALADQEVRQRLLALDDEQLQQVLSEREWEALTMGQRERVTDTHLPHIAELPRVLPELFASAAQRARDAGFDGVELHYAHAYTMASFLSATNTREDGYGGSLENRLRLPLEVFAAVRERVGEHFPAGCRFLSEECIEGGNTLQDSTRIGVALAQAGMDYLSLSRGGKFDDAKQPKVGEAAYPYTGVSGFECMPGYIADEFGPFGRNVEPTAAIRNAVRAAGLTTPVVVAGGIHTYTQAETLLAEEKADIVGIARQALADPDWFEKVRSGCGGQVRLCEYTNYCEGLDQKHKQVTCNLWDRLELDEPGVRRSRDNRRRLIAPEWHRE
ncbi:MAG: NADH:flavin oxidoreductase [Halioglobus sp.]|jgi:2,4-dienoyl-CoA reductase-like NADH-dependent reductase (Old Yellow Enzyme family)